MHRTLAWTVGFTFIDGASFLPAWSCPSQVSYHKLNLLFQIFKFTLNFIFFNHNYSYAEGEDVELKVNKLSSTRTQIPHD